MAGLQLPPRRGAAPAAGGFAAWAVWALGFRPFYLLAALFAALAVPVWALVLGGALTLPIAGIWWHAHEMLFGFACAVIVGFLYTAGRNWTGMQTPHGAALAALAGLWLAGRVALATSAGLVAGVVDALFLPAAAYGLGRVFVRAGQRRNYFVLWLLAALAVANLGFHAARWEWLPLDPLLPLHFALGLVVLLASIMGGRVIPMFTENGVGLVDGKPLMIRQLPWLNRWALILTGVALLAWVLQAGPWAAPLSLAAAGLQLARSLRWQPWQTRHVPLLWVLHLGHLWIPLGLLILAGVQLEWLPRSAAVHAFGLGAVSGLIVGMITRTALGHTGRPLVAGRVETAVYALVEIAALARVLSLVALPALAVPAVHLAATLWAAAFLLYVWRYAPWLLRARPDGRPG